MPDSSTSKSRRTRPPEHLEACGAGWDQEMCICNELRAVTRQQLLEQAKQGSTDAGERCYD
jgi:hypothetical protein